MQVAGYRLKENKNHDWIETGYTINTYSTRQKLKRLSSPQALSGDP
jgi:hypothetical protein